MNFLSLKKILIFLVLICLPGISFSNGNDDEKKGNSLHSQLHGDLLSEQINIHKEINLLDSVAFLYKLQEEEEEFPAIDLYNSNWDTRYVNPYKNDKSIQLPDSFKIDVTEYSMPTTEFTKITDVFGYRPRRRRVHYGIDLKVQIGDTIYATFSGKVRLTNYERRGYGKYIVIRHQNGLETLYGHLSKFLVNPDDIVEVGQPIGLGGNTGRSTGSHLHFETRFLGVAINPADIFDFENQVPHTDEYVFRSKKAADGSKVPASEMAYHKVKKGETLGHISLKYNVSVRQLCKLNGLKTTSTLRIGQHIRYQ